MEPHAAALNDDAAQRVVNDVLVPRGLYQAGAYGRLGMACRVRRRERAFDRPARMKSRTQRRKDQCVQAAMTSDRRGSRPQTLSSMEAIPGEDSMDYRQLIHGVNVYNSDTDESTNFPPRPYGTEPDYEAAREVAITTQDAARLVYFLNVWKCHLSPDIERMGRALGRLDEVWSLGDRTDLLDRPVDEVSAEVVACFQLLEPFTKRVGTAKLLHVFFPRFFVPWDNPIADAYGVATNARGFVLFLARCRRELLEVRQSLEVEGLDVNGFLGRLYGDHPKTMCKVLDEFNWTALSKGWIQIRTWA